MSLRWLLMAIVVLAVVVLVIAVSSAASKHDASLTYIEQQRTEQIRLSEQTKQEAQQLRAEQTTRTQNALATMLGPIIGFGVIVMLVVFADHILTRNRLLQNTTLQNMQLANTQRLLELQRNDAEYKRLAMKEQLLLTYQQREQEHSLVVQEGEWRHEENTDR